MAPLSGYFPQFPNWVPEIITNHTVKTASSYFLGCSWAENMELSTELNQDESFPNKSSLEAVQW